MVALNKLESWAEQHHPKWLDLLRILLGAFILIKGLLFVDNRDVIVTMLKDTNIEFISIIVAHYVILAHIVGGIAITIGLLTRLFIIVQIPVLIGAIFYVNLPQGFSAVNSELGFAILVLFLLIFFLIYGSGTLSLDHYLSRQKEEE